MRDRLIQSDRFTNHQKLTVSAIPAQAYSTKAPPITNKVNAIKYRCFIVDESIEIMIALTRNVNMIFNGHQPLITLPRDI